MKNGFDFAESSNANFMKIKLLLFWKNCFIAENFKDYTFFRTEMVKFSKVLNLGIGNICQNIEVIKQQPHTGY